MIYFSAVEEQIEKTRRGEDSVSHDMQVFFSSMMLSSYPHYQKLWIELYRELPGMRKNLDEYMENIMKSYDEFKKNFKK
jgi:hypothetical protein